MVLLVFETSREVELVVPTLEACGWWLDEFAVSEVGVPDRTTPRKRAEPTTRYHLLFRNTPRASG
jgi:hypothetical protein